VSRRFSCSAISSCAKIFAQRKRRSAGRKAIIALFGDAVVPVPVAAAPSQPVRSDRPQAVLEFDVENVQTLRERSRHVALGGARNRIENLQLPAPGEVAVPAAEQVVSGDARVVADRLSSEPR